MLSGSPDGRTDIGHVIMSKTDTPDPQQDPTSDVQPEEAVAVEAVDDNDPARPPSEAERAEMAASVEVALFTSEKPMAPARINEIAAVGGVRNVRRAITDLNDEYERSGRSFRIVEIAGGYQYQTQPEYGDVLTRLRKSRSDSRLSQAALETLAIVAYRQPVPRADIENIRGVACGEVLRGLMEKNLLRIAGRAEEIGRPILYGTTRHFLELFGMATIEDLPNAEQLRMPPGADEKKDEPEEPSDEEAVEDDREEEEEFIDDADDADDGDDDDDD